MTSTYPTYVFNGNVSSSQGYYVSNITNGAQIVLQSDNKFSIDINPNGSAGSNGKLGKITFFHDSIIPDTTKSYILIDNTNTSSTQTASIRFLGGEGNTTYGTIFGSSTGGLNFNNNGSIGYITMTLGTTSSSSTLNFVNSSGTPYGSIVGNTSGLNLTSNSNLNITGSGTSSTVQISNFKTLNITGADATSSVQISNISSLNAPGLGTLTASQVGTQLCLDSNNNIVKGPVAYFLYMAGTGAVPQSGNQANVMTVYNQINNGLYQNANNNTLNVNTHYLIMFNPNVTNGGNSGHTAIKSTNWPPNTFTWGFGTNTNTTYLGSGGLSLSTLKPGLISFPTIGFYKITLNIWVTGSIPTADLYLALNYGFSGDRNDFFTYPNTRNINIPFNAQFLATSSPTIANPVGNISPTPTNFSITTIFYIANDYLSLNPDRLWLFVVTGGTTGLSAYELSITRTYI